MKVLLDITLSTEELGIASNFPLNRYIVFCHDTKTLCGLKEYSSAYFDEKLKAECIEIGVFIRLLSKYFPIPYQILYSSRDTVELVDHDIENYMSFFSPGNELLPITKDFVYANVERLEAFIKSRFKIYDVLTLKEAFDKAVLSEMLRKVCISGRFIVDKKEFLQSIVSNKRLVDVKEIKKFINNNLEEIKSTIEQSNLKYGFSEESLNEILLKIRGLK